MRLTKQIRDVMIQKLCDVKFKNIISSFNSAVRNCTIEAAATRYPAKVQEWLNAAPKGGVHTRSNFYLSVGDSKKSQGLHSINPEGEYSTGTINIPAVKVLACDEYNHTIHVKETTKLGKDILEIIRQQKKMLDEFRTFRDTVRLALYGCSTSQQVEKNYPDLAKYLPPESRSTALAVTNEEVCKVLYK